MASAVASSMAAPPAAVVYGWLGPRVSFGGDAVAGQVPALPSAAAASEPAISQELLDFEFSLGGSATMLPADELFADGKLLPLRPHPVGAPERVRERPPSEIPPMPELVKTVQPAVAEAFDPYVFSPKAPTCSSRWREMLRLKKVQTPQKPSTTTTAATPSRASNSSAARSLKLLLQRNGGRASGAAASDLSVAPLLRDSSDSEASLSLASSRFSLSSSSSSGHEHDDLPRHSLDSVDPTPMPRIRLVRSQPHAHPPAAAKPWAGRSPARHRPSPPPPPPVASVDSPRMNSSGKIVFQGLERSSSSPAGSVHSSLRSRSRVMDRSYSAGVRATPVVLNMPVCSRPVFGFFKDRKDAPAKDPSSRPRSALGRKTTTTPNAGGAASVSCRDLGTSN
ncbi:hypothetical protein ABZP36_033220 [Zizania latifolia]